MRERHQTTLPPLTYLLNSRMDDTEGPEILAAPKEVADFGSARFYDDFYSDELEPFEWYHPYAMIRGIIRRYASEEEAILNLGCGNSRMTEDMVEDGYERITSVDFSRICIDQMQEKYAGVLPDTCKFIQVR